METKYILLDSIYQCISMKICKYEKYVSMRNKVIFTLLLIMIITVLYFAYRPSEVNEVKAGIYFDNNNIELSERVNISINGVLKKNLILQPKSFTGTISINSSTFEFIYPANIYMVGKTFGLTLDQYNEDSAWKFDDADGLFEHIKDDIYWSIYINKDFSKITFVPIIYGTSSTERVSAPCDNRKEAIELTQMLHSGGR